MKIEKSFRESVFSALTGTYHKHGDYIEITSWTNGEGYDININGDRHFSLHYTEWALIKKLIKQLDK
jgi:hypothetical protein